MAIEIVDFPIQNGDFPYSYVSLPEGIEFSCPDARRNLPGHYVMGWRKWSEQRSSWVAIYEFRVPFVGGELIRLVTEVFADISGNMF